MAMNYINSILKNKMSKENHLENFKHALISTIKSISEKVIVK